jgi:hypothetical protein
MEQDGVQVPTNINGYIDVTQIHICEKSTDLKRNRTTYYP